MTALPRGRLADSVRYFLLTKPGEMETYIPATAAPILVVFHSGGTQLRGASGARAMPEAFLTGPRLSVQRSVAMSGTYLLSVLFRPGRLRRFFDVDMGELAGRQIPLPDVAGRGAVEFVEQFRATRRSGALIWLTEQFLLRQEARRSQSGLLPVPGELLFQPLAALTREMGVSRRQFQRRFMVEYGVTLRDFRRLVRFERSLADLLRIGAPNLGQVAQSAGYFDHAHFNHDFRLFSGYSPSRLRALTGEEAPEVWPFRFDSGDLGALLESERKVASIQDF